VCSPLVEPSPVVRSWTSRRAVTRETSSWPKSHHRSSSLRSTSKHRLSETVLLSRGYRNHVRGSERLNDGLPQRLAGGPLGSGVMPTHDVTMNLSHPITVRNVDVEFEVRADGELMGKVQISRGGIDWMPFKSHPRAATWEQFAAWMEGTA